MIVEGYEIIAASLFIPRYANILESSLFVGVAIGSILALFIRNNLTSKLLSLTLMLSIILQYLFTELALLAILRFIIGVSFGALFLLSRDTSEKATITPIMWDVGAVLAGLVYIAFDPSMWNVGLALIAILSVLILVDQVNITVKSLPSRKKISRSMLIITAIAGVAFEVLATAESALNVTVISSYLKINPVELLIMTEIGIIIPSGLISSILARRISLPSLQILGFLASSVALAFMLIFRSDVRIDLVIYLLANAFLQIGPGTTIYAQIFNTRRALAIESLVSNFTLAIVMFYPMDALLTLISISTLGGVFSILQLMANSKKELRKEERSVIAPIIVVR